MNYISDQTRATWMLENRAIGYTYRAHFRRAAKVYAALFFIDATVIAIFALMEPAGIWRFPLAVLVLGIAIGTVVREIAWIGAVQRQWPFRERTTDWNEVEWIAKGEE